MSLIDCPECGHKVSTNAKACPQCGCAIAAAKPAIKKEALISLVIVGIFLLGLVFTNPDKDKFVSYMNTELAKQMEQSGDVTPTAKNLASGIANLFLNATVERSSFGLFSVFKIDLSSIRSFGGDAPDKKFIGVAGFFFPLGGVDAKSDSSQATTNSKATMSCKDLVGQNHDDVYSKRMDDLASAAKMTNGWYRDTEAFIYELCRGDTKAADGVVMSGGIQIDEAANIAKILGIKYTPPQRDAKSMLQEMTERKLVEFMCSACAGNAAAYFVDHPNTDTGKMIKRALDGDQNARSILSDPSWATPR